MSTICGSDLHTIGGRRTEPTPLVLGHEITGRIAALGAGLDRDERGEPLRIGDRVTWSIMAACRKCFFCLRGLPQKCVALRKYGHLSAATPPTALTGGYAEYIMLLPGTAVFRVPDILPDAVVTPANCALATVVNAAGSVGIEPGETVLIQGAGLLGLNLAALAREAGARRILVVEPDPKRRAAAARFGADLALDPGDPDWTGHVARETAGRGVDVAFEVCGAAAAVQQAVHALRIGGRYAVVGLVMPGSTMDIDGNLLTRKCLTIKGIHNYAPEHLGIGLDFLAEHVGKYPYAELVGNTYALQDINRAVASAIAAQAVRIAIRPG